MRLEGDEVRVYVLSPILTSTYCMKIDLFGVRWTCLRFYVSLIFIRQRSQAASRSSMTRTLFGLISHYTSFAGRGWANKAASPYETASSSYILLQDGWNVFFEEVTIFYGWLSLFKRTFGIHFHRISLFNDPRWSFFIIGRLNASHGKCVTIPNRSFPNSGQWCFSHCCIDIIIHIFINIWCIRVFIVWVDRSIINICDILIV